MCDSGKSESQQNLPFIPHPEFYVWVQKILKFASPNVELYQVYLCHLCFLWNLAIRDISGEKNNLLRFVNSELEFEQKKDAVQISLI